MLAEVLEGCFGISEKIRAESDTKSQTLTKLYFSNILNDLHYVCLKEIDWLGNYFFDSSKIPKESIPKDLTEASRIIKNILFRPETPDTKPATGETGRTSMEGQKIQQPPQNLIEAPRETNNKDLTSTYLHYRSFLE